MDPWLQTEIETEIESETESETDTENEGYCEMVVKLAFTDKIGTR